LKLLVQFAVIKRTSLLKNTLKLLIVKGFTV